jgi:hypothetical protein
MEADFFWKDEITEEKKKAATSIAKQAIQKYDSH